MRASWLVAIPVVALALAGCGSSERDLVQAKVEQFAKATTGKDYKTICDQVLAPTLLERLAGGGVPCERAMQVGLGAVRSPTLSIGRITISGNAATVITLTAARGQHASLDAIQLVKTSGGWRISSLGAPAAARGKR